MTSKDEPMVLLGAPHEDHDILNEFLDQRVFDSLNGNTPSPDDMSAPQDLGAFHSDLFARLKDEPSDPVLDSLHPDPHSPADLLSHVYTDAHDMLGLNQLYLDHGSTYQSPNDSLPEHPLPEHTVKPSQFDLYDLVRKEMSKVKFGNCNTNPCPSTVDVVDPLYLDFSPEITDALPFSLLVHDLPTYSRVETQIKLKFRLSPPPPQNLLHIPQDLISKSKFCLQESVDFLPDLLKQNMLFMDVYVLTSDLTRSCNVCSRCIKREQKRALRSKPGLGEAPSGDSPPPTSNALKNNPNTWADEKMMKKAIILNCKEITSFPAPTGLDNDGDDFHAFDFSARLVCYCRHHKEQNGFKLLFVLKDYTNKVVAKLLSSPIMIMDRKKNSAANGKDALDAASVAEMSVGGLSEGMGQDIDLHPISPKSIVDDSATEALVNTDTNTDSNRGLKRKKLSFDDSFNSSTNPMFNGGSGFSPLSNSDTNASVHNMNGKNSIIGSLGYGGASGFTPGAISLTLPLARQGLLAQLLVFQQSSPNPTIQKIIPAQGPIRGGIEVTLLGFNFRPGLIVKFGTKNALATHCWSETTIVTYLPPAAQPGQVLVSFENHDDIFSGGQQLIFTYTDDTDRQLIELALQIVGLKMNGKLEDAKNIAKRIVGSDGTNGASNHSTTPHNTPGMNQANMEWYDNAHKAVEVLSRSDLSTEEILINFLSLVDLPNCPIIIPNWQLCNSEGQTLLHLATLKNYSHLIKFLLTHGCKIDLKDNQGLTPLFLASMCGNRELIKVFVDCKSNWNLKLSNEKFLKDYCDLNVLDIFNALEADYALAGESSSYLASGSDVGEDVLTKSFSVDSLNSMFMADYSKHISRMVMESSANFTNEFETTKELKANHGALSSPSQRSFVAFGNDSDDFADSERDSDDNLSFNGDDFNDYNADKEDDYADDYDENDYDTSGDDDGGDERAPREGPSSSLMQSGPNLWQKMKQAVFSNNEERELPTYNDLFPFSDYTSRLQGEAEHPLDEDDSVSPRAKTYDATQDLHEDSEVASDSSEDLAMSFMNHPRKAVENDKMLLFFWTPVLVLIIGFFFYVNITGYKIERVENWKEVFRNTIGSVVVGHERLTWVFSKDLISRAIEL